MSERIPPFHPWSLNRLLQRVAHEWETRREIFGFPGRRFFKRNPSVDLGITIGDRTVATPLGPAAGPHTQLAQNIVLGWLAGARSFELKTVQILDELHIDRPCIDMENVGYNIEWSQELTLDQSLQEYAKAWLLLEVLRRWEPLREVLGDPGDHLFELSVGYDLAGIRSEKMREFIDGLRRAEPIIDGLREEIDGPFAHLRDVPVSGEIISTATLSTFHGCPPDEVEEIIQHLMSAHGLDVTVKLNPTLLGFDTVAAVINDRLGYRDVELVPDAFAEDMKFERAIEMIGRLQEFAVRQGREFGIKLTNTLVVANKRGLMPGDRMYLSGPPLHVLAVTLLDRLHGALPGVLRLGVASGPVPVAFSAGIDKDNLADTVALGLAPVTICSDLLKPGGYGRMAQGLRKLTRAMADAGCTDLSEWRAAADAAAKAAGRRNAVAALAHRLAAPCGSDRYSLAATDKGLREVDHELEMFDCVACGNCVTVCPNNAFFTAPTRGEDLQARSQYFVLAEICNECGNCTTFCPEEGSPHLIKPRLYLDRAAWQANDREGYLIAKTSSGAVEMVAGPGGAEDEETARRLAELLGDGKGAPFNR